MKKKIMNMDIQLVSLFGPTLTFTHHNLNSVLKSDNLQYNTLGRWVDRLINQASDGPSIILID